MVGKTLPQTNEEDWGICLAITGFDSCCAAVCVWGGGGRGGGGGPLTDGMRSISAMSAVFADGGSDRRGRC